MPDDCGCRKPGDRQKPLTRREFIKTSGTFAAGLVMARVPHIPLRDPNFPPTTLDPGTIQAALDIAAADGMFQEADTELRALGLVLDFSVAGVRFSGVMGSLIGLVLQHKLSPSRRMGTDVTLTVDLNAGVLISVQVLTGWSLVDMLEISSITYNYRDDFSVINGTNKNGAFTVLIRPKTEKYWSFPYESAPPFMPDDLVETGWPPQAEDPAAGYWQYANGSRAEWLTDRGEWVYSITQVKEVNAFHGDLWTDLPTTGEMGG